MADGPHPATPIREFADLVRHFQRGEKPASNWLLGLEHEKVGVLPGGAAPAYAAGERDGIESGGIESVLGALRDRAGWSEVREGETLIGLKREAPIGAASVSLEPGGQLELSDAPRASATDAARAVRQHLAELAPIARERSIAFLATGFRPFGTLDDVPWMPKGRYRVMRAYLPSRGAMAHEMMKRTATAQVNLDYESEADCAEKMRAAMGTSSIVTALFAASPLVDGRATDYQSYRAACWLATDEDRCGLLPFVFADGAAERLYADYAEWALDVPMFFVYRDGEYRAAGGLTFRRFLAEGAFGARATDVDWELHLSTLFPEVRLKQYLEMRGADAGPLPLVFALPSLYRGLLYDREARASAFALVARWSFEERVALRREVPRLGLRAKIRGVELGSLALELVAIARAGLTRLGAFDDAALLEPLEAIARTGRTTADDLRQLHVDTGGDPDRIASAISLPLD